MRGCLLGVLRCNECRWLEFECRKMCYDRMEEEGIEPNQLTMSKSPSSAGSRTSGAFVREAEEQSPLSTYAACSLIWGKRSVIFASNQRIAEGDCSHGIRTSRTSRTGRGESAKIESRSLKIRRTLRGSFSAVSPIFGTKSLLE